MAISVVRPQSGYSSTVSRSNWNLEMLMYSLKVTEKEKLFSDTLYLLLYIFYTFDFIFLFPFSFTQLVQDVWLDKSKC